MYLKELEFKIALKLENNSNYIYNDCIKLCESALICRDVNKKQKKEILKLKDCVLKMPDPYGWKQLQNLSDLNLIIECLNVLMHIVKGS